MCNASFHVDSAVRDDQVTNIEGAEPEVEIQEPEVQLYVGADQEPEPEPELTNFYNTQGKPRFILKPSVTTLSLSVTITTIFMH